MPVKLPSKDLFFARAYYFAFMGGWGFILPFVNLFYVSIGLSGTQIGTIASPARSSGWSDDAMRREQMARIAA